MSRRVPSCVRPATYKHEMAPELMRTRESRARVHPGFDAALVRAKGVRLKQLKNPGLA